MANVYSIHYGLDRQGTVANDRILAMLAQTSLSVTYGMTKMEMMCRKKPMQVYSV